MSKSASDVELRVLIVEDDPAVRRLIERWCDAHRFEHSSAANADEAIKALETAPKLVFADLILGLDSGWVVVRTAANAGAAVVVVTGSGVDEDLRADARLMGAHAVLGKPFTDNELWAAVRRALSARPL